VIDPLETDKDDMEGWSNWQCRISIRIRIWKPAALLLVTGHHGFSCVVPRYPMCITYDKHMRRNTPRKRSFRKVQPELPLCRKLHIVSLSSAEIAQLDS
jgi:hypothetical protein